MTSKPEPGTVSKIKNANGMARPKLDPSGIDNVTPKARIAVFVHYSVRERYEAIWENEKASSRDPKSFIGFGSWLGLRIESLLDAEESRYKYSSEYSLPFQNRENQDVIVIPDTENLAKEILRDLLPDLSDVLRRTAFKAMERVGRETGETLASAMIAAVESGIAGTTLAATERAAMVASMAIIPELRKLRAAVDALSAPVEIWDEEPDQ